MQGSLVLPRPAQFSHQLVPMSWLNGIPKYDWKPRRVGRNCGRCPRCHLPIAMV